MMKLVLRMIFPLVLMVCSHLYAQNTAEMEKIAEKTNDYRLFYNIGVVYAKEGKLGLSVLNLKRAYQLNPYDNEVKEALYRQRSVLGLPRFYFEPSPLETVLLFLFTVFDLNTTFLIGAIALIAGLLILSLLWSHLLESFKLPISAKLTAILKTLSIVLLLFGLVYIFSSVIRYNILFDSSHAVIVTDSTLLETPEKNALVIAEMPSGMECRIVRQIPEYYLVHTIVGKEGWIETNKISPLWEKE